MSKIKALCLVVFVAAAVPVFGQRQVSQDRYGFILDSIKSLPKVSAVNLYAEYEKNGVSWEETYKDRYRIIAGVITNVGRDVLGMERVISLKTRSEVIKGLPGYRTIDVVYPEKLPENVKKALSAYKVGQNVELFVRFRKTPDSIDAVYYDESLPREYTIYTDPKENRLIFNVPDRDIGKNIIIKDADGDILDRTVIRWNSLWLDNAYVPDGAYSIEVGDFSIKISEIK
jgi:hypothetical protein